MRIINSEDKRGFVEIEIEDEDDLWHLYNIIEVGDQVCGNTTREIKVSRGESEERVGRKRVFLCIRVEDTGLQSFTGKLRIRGKIISAPENLNILGSYHSFAVGPRDRIGITKENWSSFCRERLATAVNKPRPKIVMVTLDEQEANIYIVKDYELQEVVSIKSEMPGKYVENQDRDLIKSKYFAAIEEELQRIMKGVPYTVVIAGPGFTKSHLAKYLKERHRDLSIFEESTSSIGEPGVREVMNRGTISRILQDTSIARDSRLIDEMLARLSKTPKLVAYGISEVENATNAGAVEVLLVSDRLIRGAQDEQKKRIEMLCKAVEKYGGKVYFIGSEHEKGMQLYNIGGVAAFLRFHIGN